MVSCAVLKGVPCSTWCSMACVLCLRQRHSPLDRTPGERGKFPPATASTSEIVPGSWLSPSPLRGAPLREFRAPASRSEFGPGRKPRKPGRARARPRPPRLRCPLPPRPSPSAPGRPPAGRPPASLPACRAGWPGCLPSQLAGCLAGCPGWVADYLAAWPAAPLGCARSHAILPAQDAGLFTPAREVDREVDHEAIVKGSNLRDPEIEIIRHQPQLRPGPGAFSPALRGGW